MVAAQPQQTKSFRYIDAYPKNAKRTTRSRWRGAQCGSCQQWSLWNDGHIVYPPQWMTVPAHVDMPHAVRELYEEAAAVAFVSRRAGAALARATMEHLLKHLDPNAPKRMNLDGRIARVRKRVTTPTGQLLDLVRVTGNGAVHVDDDPSDIVVIALSDTEGPALLELLLEATNSLVDELITRPKLVSSLWEKLPDATKAKIEPDHS